MSPEIYHRELPIAIGQAHPLTISDDLQTPAIAAEPSPALSSINAGLDLALYAQSEDGSAIAYTRLLEDARSGLLNIAQIRKAARRIEALKLIIAH
jgi:hypothetical protein